MRISDWSSDVCSSDLRLVRSSKTLSAESMLLRNLTYGPSGNILWFMQRSEERRVGSVSVRVDLGGRRIIKKKNNEKQKDNVRKNESIVTHVVMQVHN